jgi:hypothetical protein
LVFENDTDAYARDRDKEVIGLAKKAGVEVITKVGRTLYDPDELVKANGGKPTMSITQVQHVRYMRLMQRPSAVDRLRLAKSYRTFHDRFRRRRLSPAQETPRLVLIRRDHFPNQT